VNLEPASSPEPIGLAGDAVFLLTAPFHADQDALTESRPLRSGGMNDLTPTGSLSLVTPTFTSLFKGTLTFAEDQPANHLQFAGSAEFRTALAARISAAAGCGEVAAVEVVEISGIIFPDGYGAIAVTMCRAAGWEPDARSATLEIFGRAGREIVAQVVRTQVRAELTAALATLGRPMASPVVIPYFNMTYVGESPVEEPGRRALAAEFRPLVYPNSPDPLRSVSPWRDQFFYAGYAYSLMIMKDPRAQVEKLALLMLMLNVLYVRLARTASAADALLLGDAHADTASLARITHRLRSQYQALVTPTFSYDHHALRLRDAILHAWDAEKLQTRTLDLLGIVRENVAARVAQEQARRIRKVNVAVGILTGLSVIATVDAAVSLADRVLG
jgi:hypothetical protein